jgi:hypothetical protein
MPKRGQEKGGSSRNRVAGAPYDPVSNSSRRTRSGRSNLVMSPEEEEEDDNKGKKQREKRITRSAKANCSIYGLDRYIRFPGYKFCQNCTFCDNAVEEANKLHHSSSKDSQIHRCRSEHTSWCFPTQKIVPHFTLQQKSMRDSTEKKKQDSESSASDSDDSSDSQQHETTPNTTNNKVEFLKQEEEIQFLRRQLGQKDDTIKSLHRQFRASQRQCSRLENIGATPQIDPPEEGEFVQSSNLKGKE